MLVAFFALLLLIFTPVFPGKVNGLDYMDNLFNMISKGSSYFIPKAIEDSDAYAGKMLKVTIKVSSDTQAEETAKLFAAGGAKVDIAGSELTIAGEIGDIMKNCLADADLLFNNNGDPLVEKYGYDAKQVVFNWWAAFNSISKALTSQKDFTAAKSFGNIQKKALEPAYNYYGVNSEKWQANVGMVLASLAFYVFYTLWYGFGLMYLFEGLGLRIGH